MSKRYFTIPIWNGIEVSTIDSVNSFDEYEQAVDRFRKMDGFDIGEDIPLIIQISGGEITDVIIPSREEITPNA